LGGPLPVAFQFFFKFKCYTATGCGAMVGSSTCLAAPVVASGGKAATASQRYRKVKQNLQIKTFILPETVHMFRD